MAGFVAGLSSEPKERLTQLARAPQQTSEVILERMRAAIIIGNTVFANRQGQELLKQNPWQWRAVWYQGVAAMQAEDWTSAIAHFNAVYGQLPGELAPKFALAVACERGGQKELAEHLFAVCATTDANYVTGSAFGLARLRAERGDRAGILQALELVPGTSSGYSSAQRMRADQLLAQTDTPESLLAAWEAITAAQLDQQDTANYQAKILSRALPVLKKHPEAKQYQFGNIPFTDAAIRSQLESTYRQLANYQEDAAEHNRLIEQANTTRKWSLL